MLPEFVVILAWISRRPRQAPACLARPARIGLRSRRWVGGFPRQVLQNANPSNDLLMQRQSKELVGARGVWERKRLGCGKPWALDYWRVHGRALHVRCEGPILDTPAAICLVPTSGQKINTVILNIKKDHLKIQLGLWQGFRAANAGNNIP